jgi:hypothetical protein
VVCLLRPPKREEIANELQRVWITMFVLLGIIDAAVSSDGRREERRRRRSKGDCR